MDQVDDEVYKSIAYGNLEELKRLTSSPNFDFNPVDVFGNSFLMIAVLHGRFEIAKFLIEKGANVNVVDRCNETPLIRACIKGDSKMISLLIKSKAKVNIELLPNRPPLWYAISCGNRSNIKELLKNGANLFLDNWISLLWVYKILEISITNRNVGHPKIYQEIDQFNYRRNLGISNTNINDRITEFTSISSNDVLKCLIDYGKIDLLRREQSFLYLLPKDIIDLIKDYVF